MRSCRLQKVLRPLLVASRPHAYPDPVDGRSGDLRAPRDPAWVAGGTATPSVQEGTQPGAGEEDFPSLLRVEATSRSALLWPLPDSRGAWATCD